MASRDNDRLPTQRKFETRPGKYFEKSTESNFEFQIIEAGTKQIEAKTAMRMARTRDWLALVIVSGIAIALTVSAIHGYFEGNYDKLHWVWTVVAPFVGGVVGFYFGRKME